MRSGAATCGIGKAVVQTSAQRGSREGEGRLNGRVRLHVVLRGRARSRHPVHVRLPLAHSQLLPQVLETKRRGFRQS